MATTAQRVVNRIVGKDEGITAWHVEDQSSDLPLTSSETEPQSLKNIETVALVVEKPKAEFTLQKVIYDEVREDEFLIEMKYSGICHTDIVLQQGLLEGVCEYPAIFGHEGGGIVRGVGSNVRDKSIKVGDPVCLSFVTCGHCEQCKLGHPAYCWNFTECNHFAQRYSDKKSAATLEDGRRVGSMYFGHSSFSKMSVVKDQCVVKYNGDVKDMGLYAAAGCGFQTGAGAILNILKPEPHQSTVVFGLGGVGLTALMAAKYMKVEQIIAVDIQPEKLKLAAELGATHVINSKEADAVVEIKKITGGGAAFALECTGVIKCLEQSIECLRPLGIAGSIGVPPPGVKLSIDPLTFLLESKRYYGLIEGDSVPPEFVPRLIQLHRDGHMPLEKLVTIYPVDKFKEALHDMHKGKAIKAVVSWD